MNYLGHYVFNCEVRRLEPEPYFTAGVALPDLWPRFSRSRRLRWPRVRQAEPSGTRARALRAGLLNHFNADRRFHSLPWFIDSQRDLKATVACSEIHPATTDFLAHIALELALDRRLVYDNPRRAEDFYDCIALCDADAVARATGALASVDADGLAGEIRGFVHRRFLARFAEAGVLVEVVRYILSLTSIPDMPSDDIIARFLDRATIRIDPDTVWRQMCAKPTENEGGGTAGGGRFCHSDRDRWSRGGIEPRS